MNTYDYIADKINKLKTQYPSLRQSKEDKADDYAFSALCIKANFYKNPELPLNDNDFDKMIVDGSNDGGADILLSNPNSEVNDLIIGQSKFRKELSYDDVFNAMVKMARFYKDMMAGNYRYKEQVCSRFIELHDKLDEDSKIHFVFYTIAPHKKSIDTARIEHEFRELLIDADDTIEVEINFAADIKKEIHDADSWKQIVDSGKIETDNGKNILRYGDDAVIVNASAFSIKQLYFLHGTNLLALNLRYHIKERKSDGVDNAITNTIDKAPETFWLKNNGITIICDDFRIDGNEVHLRNFSIVNGGQTTHQLSNNKNVTKKNTFYLTCKIIRNIGNTADEKNSFSLEIAQAANSQKPITQEDLKANAPEQISFAKAMRAVEVFYQTKRGEKIPKQYAAHQHTKIRDIGNLCMAAIFQMPFASRSNAKMFYKEMYYNYIFKSDQKQVADIGKELVYMDYYFKKKFLPAFKSTNSGGRLSFARLAKTICIAFTALAARWHQGNITDEDFTMLTSDKTEAESKSLYKNLRELGSMQSLLPPKFWLNKDVYDATLDKLFKAIIVAGTRHYSVAHRHNSTLTLTNFFKKDQNYYDILHDYWDEFQVIINEIFQED